MAKTIITNTSGTAYPRYQHDDGNYYSYPQPAGAPDWNTLLARTGTGTPDPTFDPRTDISYIGSFRIPFFQTGVTGSRQKTCLTFRPPEGSNGPNGSVFFGGQNGWSEHQIPTLSTSTDYTALPAATVLQSWFNCRAAAPNAGEPSADVGGLGKYIDGKLYMTYYVYYPGASNPQQMLICNDASDLAGSSYQGMMSLNGGDHVLRYMFEIPSDKRSLFGGHTHFSGICTEIGIVGRSSFGHSLYSWTPGAINPGDTSAPSTQRRYFPDSAPHYWMSNDNGAVKQHYEALLGMSLESYVSIPTSSRLTDLSGLPQPDSAIRKHMITYNTRCGCAFIPPGTNTIVFIGHTRGARYGIIYKSGTLEFGSSGPVSGGFAPASYYDKDNAFWTLNLNDVASASTPQDADYIEYGHFLQEPWSAALGKDRAYIMAGDFDPATGTLYLLHDNVPFSAYESQHIVSVYQVGGGE